ncbi:MAG: serine/threonine-protein kinase [Nitrospirota bacterium]
MAEKIGRYEIIKTIGQGAMGLVYKAKDPMIDRIVAIKTIRQDSNLFARDAEEVKGRFRREAQVAGKLSHPGIVTIYDVGEEGGLFYIVMEYVEGETLDRIIDAKRLPDLDKSIDLMLQVCDAIGYAHKNGIIHRDIKPANVMIVDKKLVKVMDFGIARIASSDMTQTGKVIGTPNYMSPEQVMGVKVDHRTDIFSLGVALYELLTGEKAFPGESITTVIYRILHEDPISPRKLKLQLPSSLDYIVNKAISKDIEKRYQNVEEFTKDLKNYRNPASLPAGMDSAARKASKKAEPEAEDTLSMSGANPPLPPLSPLLGKEGMGEVRGGKRGLESELSAKKKPSSPNMGYLLIGLLILIVVVGGGLVFFKKGQRSAREEKKAESPLPEAKAPERAQVAEPVKAVEAAKTPEPVRERYGAININARPRSEIFINGKSYGQTPNTISNLTVGEHEIILKNNDFPPWKETVKVEENELTKISHNFIPKKEKEFGSLMINSKPWGVVYLNGRQIGATPITIPKVPEGRHKIKVVREGFKELEMDIRVEPKKKNTLSLKLEKK